MGDHPEHFVALHQNVALLIQDNMALHTSYDKVLVLKVSKILVLLNLPAVKQGKAIRSLPY